MLDTHNTQACYEVTGRFLLAAWLGNESLILDCIEASFSNPGCGLLREWSQVRNLKRSNYCSFQALNIWSIMYVACVDYDSYDGKLSVEKNLATESTLMPKVSKHR